MISLVGALKLLTVCPLKVSRLLQNVNMSGDWWEMFWAGKALESPGWWWVALIQTNCWSASAHRQVRETPRTVLGLWHRYTLIVTPLATRNRCSGDGGDGGGGGGGLCTLQYHQIYLSDLSFLLCFLNVKAGDNDGTMTKWITVCLTLMTRSSDTNKAFYKY